MSKPLEIGVERVLDKQQGAPIFGRRQGKSQPNGESAEWPGEQPTANSANTNGEDVGCWPEEETESEPEIIQFPPEAWSGPFKTWRGVVVPCTEAPEEYLWASCLILIGLVLGRSVRVENPRPIFPNFYVLLMGQTGDDRKSTSLSFASDALYRLGMAAGGHASRHPIE